MVRYYYTTCQVISCGECKERNNEQGKVQREKKEPSSNSVRAYANESMIEGGQQL